MHILPDINPIGYRRRKMTDSEQTAFEYYLSVIASDRHLMIGEIEEILAVLMQEVLERNRYKE